MPIEDNLKSIIKDAYGKNVEVLEIENRGSTAPGDNYGSALLFLTARIIDESETETNLPLVVKGLPASEFYRECFNVDICFPKEAAFYQKVVPEYTKLQKEKGIGDDECFKAFPNFVGAKFGPNGEVVEDTILALENLTPKGFRVGSRIDGLDLAHSKLVLKEIALFHALGIALKKHKPEIYQEVIRKDVGRSLKIGKDKEEIMKNEIGPFSEEALAFLETLNECAELVPRLRRAINNHFHYDDMFDTYVPREPFCTFVHNDLWVNNIMFNYNECGEPESVKLLDFQRTKVGSPLCDILLFLYTSAKLAVMKTNFMELLKVYHDNLFASLERLGAAAEELNWDNFRRELSDYGSENIFMPVCLLRVVTGKNTTDDFTEVSTDFSAYMHDECRLRHIEVVRDLAERGWI